MNTPKELRKKKKESNDLQRLKPFFGEVSIMSCCKTPRKIYVCVKHSNMCFISSNIKSNQNYVPYDLGIGGGDYIQFMYCLNCGKIHGNFPLPTTMIELKEEQP